jgi:non-ribosomal peptide synthetase component E (peptide arylation enzyme)
MSTILTLLGPERLREHYEAGHWRAETLYSVARGHAEGAPDAIAIRDRHRRVSYRDLAAAADRMAADLQSQRAVST